MGNECHSAVEQANATKKAEWIIGDTFDNASMPVR